MAKIIDDLVQYMLAARSAKLPPEVIQKGKSHLLDSLAAIVSGSQLKPGQLGLQHARAQGGKEECSVLGTNFKTTPIVAAFANGMSGHADETDDSNSQLHPGCAIVPAALALAELQNRDGDALLRAVILGYDIGFRFHQAFEPRSTSFGATFGASAAAAALAELDALQLCYLVSYAAQQASGSRAWVGDDDHIEKAFDYAGMPARNGVTAVLLIKSGFTGNRDVLEGDQGIIKTYAPCDPKKLLAELGQRFTITSCLVKKYPVGSPMMETVDATLALLAKRPIRAEDVEKIIVRIPPSGARTVNNRNMPDVNVQYMVSAILVDGKLTFESAHDYERFKNPRVLALKEKVQLVGDEEMERSGPRFQGLVEISLKDGKTLREHVINCRGRPENPMDPEEVEKKAAWLMEPVLGKSKTDQIIEASRRIETVGSARDLANLLT
ncbi:MAG TPA: MmgE/PrpD family protein, partial [Candidatus Acidoferrales bacterium]|nr:MmgE/PrpD family protein [Candidatus Acidoferrales bacterium]